MKKKGLAVRKVDGSLPQFTGKPLIILYFKMYSNVNNKDVYQGQLEID